MGYLDSRCATCKLAGSGNWNGRQDHSRNLELVSPRYNWYSKIHPGSRAKTSLNSKKQTMICLLAHAPLARGLEVAHRDVHMIQIVYKCVHDRFGLLMLIHLLRLERVSTKHDGEHPGMTSSCSKKTSKMAIPTSCLSPKNIYTDMTTPLKTHDTCIHVSSSIQRCATRIFCPHREFPGTRIVKLFTQWQL